MSTTNTEWNSKTTTTHTIEHTTQQQSRFVFDVTQLKTVNGILKSAVIFLTLVGGILSAAGNTVGPYYNVGSSDFTTFTCFTAMLQNVIYLVMYLFGTTPFLILELATGGLWTLLLLIAGCIMVPYANVWPVRGATVFFNWVAAIVLFVDCFLKFRQGRSDGRLGIPRQGGVVAGGKFWINIEWRLRLFL